MKRMVSKYRISKFKCFLNGLVFAVISIAALLLCIYELDHTASETAAILPFIIAIASLLSGMASMFRRNVNSTAKNMPANNPAKSMPVNSPAKSMPVI